MSIEQELVLDISPAQHSISEIGDDLEAIGADAGAHLGDSIASGIEDAVARLDLHFDVSGITENVQTAFTEAFDTITANPIVIPVTADTTQAIEDINAIEASPLTITPDVDTTQITGDITDAIAVLDPSVTVSVNTDQIAQEIDTAADAAHPEVDVHLGNAAAIQDEIDSVVGEADASVDVEANVDASGVQKAGDQINKTLGESTKVGAAGLGNLVVATSALDGATELAEGKVSGLGEAVSKISPGAAAAVGGFAALGAASAVLFHEGLSVQTAEDRLTLAFGRNAKAVKEIDIGGLTGDLGELAIQTGSSDSDLIQAVGTIGLFGKESGATRVEVKGTSQEIAALALHSAAVRPELGGAADQATALQRALATGGRAAQNFGLSLQPAAIQARAFQIATADGRSEVTRFDLVSAGAQLAVKQLGKSLGTDFKAGTETADRQFAAVQARIEATFSTAAVPVVKPLLDALKSVEPAAENLGVALAGLASEVIPVVADLVRAVAPVGIVLTKVLTGLIAPVHAVVDVLDAVDPQLIEIAGGLFLFSKALDSAFAAKAVRSGVAFLGQIQSFGAAVRKSAADGIAAAEARAAGTEAADGDVVASNATVIESEAELAAEMDRVNARLGLGTSAAVEEQAASVATLDESIAGLDVSIASIAESLAGLNAALGDTVAADEEAAAGLDTVTGAADTAAAAMGPVIGALEGVQAATAPIGPEAQGAAAGLSELEALFAELAPSTGAAVDEFGVLDAELAALGEEGAVIATGGVGALDTALAGAAVSADAGTGSLGFFATILAIITGEAESATAALADMDIALGPIGIGIVAIGALAAAFGLLGGSASDAGDQVSEAAKKIFEIQEPVDQAQKGIGTLRDRLVDYIRSQDAFKTDDLSATLAKQGLSVTTLANDFAAGGSKIAQLRDTIQGEIDALDLQRAKIVAATGGAGVYTQKIDEQRASLVGLKSTIESMNDDLTKSAKQQIALGLSTGAVTSKELAGIESRNRLKDGTVNYIAVAESLKGVIQEQADAQAAAQAADERAAAQKRILASQLGGTAQGWKDLSGAVADGSITLNDATKVSQQYGLSAADATTFIQGMQKAIDDFVKSAVSQLPTVADALNNVVTAASGLNDLGTALSTFTQAQQTETSAAASAVSDAADRQKQSIQDVDQAYKDSTDARKKALQDQENDRQRAIDAQKDSAQAEIDRLQALSKADPNHIGDSGALLIDAQARLKAIEDSSKAGANTSKDAIAAIDAEAAAHAKSVDGTLSALDKSTKSKIQSINDTAKSAKFDVTGFLGQLQQGQIQTQAFFDGINHIAANGFPDLAVDLEKLGPAVGGPVVAALEGQGPAIQKAYQDALTPKVDLATFVTNLVAQTQDIQRFSDNVLAIAAKFPNAAAALIQQGPLKGGSIAQQIKDAIVSGDPKGNLLAAGLEQQLTDGTSKGAADYKTALTTKIAPILADAGILLTSDFVASVDSSGAIKITMKNNAQAVADGGLAIAAAAAKTFGSVSLIAEGQLRAVPTAVADALVKAKVAVEIHNPGVAAAAGQGAGEATIRFTKNFNPASGVGAKVLEAAGVIDKSGDKTAASGKTLGHKTGQGVADGITDKKATIQDAIVTVAHGISSDLGDKGVIGTGIGGGISAGIAAGILAHGPAEIGGAIVASAGGVGNTLTALGAGIGLGGFLAQGIVDGVSLSEGAITAEIPKVLGGLGATLGSVGAGVPLGAAVVSGMTIGMQAASGQIGKQIPKAADTVGNTFGAIAAGIPLGASLVTGVALGVLVAGPSIGTAIQKSRPWIPHPEQVLVGAGLELMSGLAAGITLGFALDVIPVLHGITKRIPEEKGPPAADFALLQGAGRLIMGGFQKSLEDGARPVDAFLSDLGPHLAGQLSSKPFKAPVLVEVAAVGGGTLDDQFRGLGETAGAAFADTARVRATTVRPNIDPVIAAAVATTTPGGTTTTAAGPTNLATKADVEAAVQRAVANGGVHLAAGASVVGKIEATAAQDPEAIAAKTAFKIGAR